MRAMCGWLWDYAGKKRERERGGWLNEEGEEEVGRFGVVSIIAPLTADFGSKIKTPPGAMTTKNK